MKRAAERGPTYKSLPHPTAVGLATALIVLDGLSDHASAGGPPTPLDLAATPELDRRAAEGRLGRLSILGSGVAPESDAGVLALLGYDPVHDSPGRGVLEALGAGIPLAPGDVAFRSNFATVDGDGRLLDSRVGRNLGTTEASTLARALSDANLLASEGIRAELRSTVGHRGVLWLHPTDDRPLSADVSNSDPFYEKVGGMGRAVQVGSPRPLPVRPLDESEAARRTAEAVNRFLERASPLLAGHTVNARRAMGRKRIANALLLRNAGMLPRPPPARFEERYRMAGAAITEMPVERGLARLFGLEDRFVGPMGADRAAALQERARRTRGALEERPFVYVHLKGPDEPGHDGDAARKQSIIEAIDAEFFVPFFRGLDPGAVRVAITADHATPAANRGHSDDPVPLLLWGAGVGAMPAPLGFSELGCEAGALGTRPARELLPLLLGGLPPP
jgi:2,3-bisphosphoglycerate-independent phosphoglycerate mutase